MTPRQRRMATVAVVFAGVSIAAWLALRAFSENLLYFYTPSQIIAGQSPRDKTIRLGGLVTKGSLHRDTGSLMASFEVTDLKQTMTVTYTGVLPDLFREGQGVIAHGTVQPDGRFRADEVLAKHDEKYMPPEVAKSLAEQGHPITPEAPQPPAKPQT
jgi:cytochrome c-type biogenesis protein CcmE